MIMKRDENLICVTNKDTGESRFFTKDAYAALWIGCSPAGLNLIKVGSTRKFPQWQYEIKYAGDILWKDINRTK